MTDASAFNPEEWDLLVSGLLQPALSVSLGERGGTLVEMLALYDSLGLLLKLHSQHPLMADLLRRMMQRKAADALRAYDEVEPHELSALALSTLRAALNTLQMHASPGEQAAYRRIVRQLCEDVARANVESGQPTPISELEQAILRRIDAVLAE